MMSLLAFFTIGMSSAQLYCPAAKFEENTERQIRLSKLLTARACIWQNTAPLMKNLEELRSFSDGSTLRSLVNQYQIVLDLYPQLKQECSQPENTQLSECVRFNKETLNSPEIVISYFHFILFANDSAFLKKWISVMPVYDLNVILRPDKIMVEKDRFTYAELAAGYPNISVESLKALVEAGLISKTSDESYPLHKAVKTRSVDRFDYLVSQGFDVNQQAYRNLSKYLKPKGISMAEPEQGYTPLIRAIAAESEVIFRKLLSNTAIDVNKPDVLEGSSPLMHAAMMASYGQNGFYFYKLLADPRVDLNFQNKVKHTVLNYVSDLSSDPKVARYIINSPKFDPNAHCHETNPCLAPVISQVNLSLLKVYEPLIKKMDFSYKSYGIREKVDGKFFEKTHMTIMDFVDTKIELERDAKRLKELQKIKKYLIKLVH